MVKDQRLGGPDDPAAARPTGATLERLLGRDSNIMRAVLEGPPPLGPRRADDMLRDAEHALGDSLGAGGSAERHPRHLAVHVGPRHRLDHRRPAGRSPAPGAPRLAGRRHQLQPHRHRRHQPGPSRRCTAASAS
jgi:hypothetical protein